MSKELRDTHEEDWKTESFYEEVNMDLDAMRGKKPNTGVFETDEEFFGTYIHSSTSSVEQVHNS